VEFGAGEGKLGERLLGAAGPAAAYVGLELSGARLAKSKKRLAP